MEAAETLNKYKQMINDSLDGNSYCAVGIIDDERIFCGYRKNRPELLVLVSSLIGGGDIWGHVFFKKGHWISCLVQITGYFGGQNEGQLIKDYWVNIQKRAGWLASNSLKGQQFIARSPSLNTGIEELVKLINKFHPDIAADMAVDAEVDTDFFGIYGVASLIHGCLYAR